MINHSNSQVLTPKYILSLVNATAHSLNVTNNYSKSELNYPEFLLDCWISLKRYWKTLRIYKTQSLCRINSESSNLSGIVKNVLTRMSRYSL